MNRSSYKIIFIEQFTKNQYKQKSFILVIASNKYMVDH